MKPSIPKGTRDFGPEQVRKRNFIFATIEAVFSKYGFARIETPAMESLDTLTGKYGAEGDQLLFKVLNNGDFLSKVEFNFLLKDFKFNPFGVQTDLKKADIKSFISVMLML